MFVRAELIIPGLPFGSPLPTSTDLAGSFEYAGTDIANIKVQCVYAGGENQYICVDDVNLPTCEQATISPTNASANNIEQIDCGSISQIPGVANPTMTSSTPGSQSVICSYNFGSSIPGYTLFCPMTINIEEA